MDEATLKLSESKLGTDHPSTLTSRNSLAQDYLAAGRTAEAIRMDEATLKLSESKLGPDHPSTLRTMNNLAEAYLDANRWVEAERTAPSAWVSARRSSPMCGLRLTRNPFWAALCWARKTIPAPSRCSWPATKE